MRVPIGTVYTARVTGCAWVPVVCSHCGSAFEYKVSRSASGNGISILGLNTWGAKSTARRRAAHSLQVKLQFACGVAPCPECGEFQEDMVELVKAEAQTDAWRGTLQVGGILGLLCLCAVGAVPPPYQFIVIVCFLAPWIWITLRLFKRADRINPGSPYWRSRMTICDTRRDVDDVSSAKPPSAPCHLPSERTTRCPVCGASFSGGSRCPRSTAGSCHVCGRRTDASQTVCLACATQLAKVGYGDR